MKKTLQRLWAHYEKITTSIAFYPSIYAVLSVILGFVMTFVERAGISRYLQEHISILVVKNKDTALNILTTLIAGGFSMLIFTFSMVMLLLSQAATNFSPRVLPSLISNKKHQFILGTFLSTILFNIIIVTSIEPGEENYQVPGFSVLLGIISAVIALIAFVYFIHSISTSIQISNIMENIYNATKQALQTQINLECKQPEKDKLHTDAWHSYKTSISGSIQSINTKKLLETATDLDIQIHVVVPKGRYLFDHMTLFKSTKKLDDNAIKKVLSNFIFDESEIVSNNFELGFKQLTEIGVKAMSPGINDPGTALGSLNYLSELTTLRMHKKNHTYVFDSNQYLRIQLELLDFSTLVHQFIAAFRTYCKHDFILVQKLISILINLHKSRSIDPDFNTIIAAQAKLVLDDGLETITNDTDRKLLQELYDSLN